MGDSLDRYQTEDLIYEAAFVPERWPDLLAHLAKRGQGVGAVVFCVNKVSAAWAASPSIAGHMHAFVCDGWSQRNSRVKIGQRLGPAGLHRFLTEADFFPDSDPFVDPLYRDFFVPRGMGYSAGAMIELPHQDTVVVSLERSVRDGPFERHRIEDLDRLYPHLVRAGMIAGRLAYKAVANHVEAYAQLNLPAVAVTRDGRIVTASAQWEGDADVWKCGAHNHLWLSDGEARKKLADILAAPGWLDRSQTIPIRVAEVLAGFLHLVPVRRDARDLFGADTAVLVFSRSMRKVTNAARLIEGVLEISAAEAKVAVRLAEGKSAKAIAQELGKSPETIRNQIRSIQSKLNCRKSAEIVRILSDLI